MATNLKDKLLEIETSAETVGGGGGGGGSPTDYVSTVTGWDSQTANLQYTQLAPKTLLIQGSILITGANNANNASLTLPSGFLSENNGKTYRLVGHGYRSAGNSTYTKNLSFFTPDNSNIVYFCYAENGVPYDPVSPFPGNGIASPGQIIYVDILVQVQ